MYYNVTEVRVAVVGQGKAACECHIRALTGTYIKFRNGGPVFHSPTWYPNEMKFELADRKIKMVGEANPRELTLNSVGHSMYSGIFKTLYFVKSFNSSYTSYINNNLCVSIICVPINKNKH